MMGQIEAAFGRARRRAPALLILDDVDVVAPTVSSLGQGEVGGDRGCDGEEEEQQGGGGG